MINIRRSILGSVAALALLAGSAAAQRPVELSPDAPPDRPQTIAECQWSAALLAMAPYEEQARASYPDAKRRFLAGLPGGHTFFVTTRLRDETGQQEQVFVAVDSIAGARIVGRIWSRIHLVRGYRLGQSYEFADSALVDWMVARPDGGEEGNYVGKFLDTYRPPPTCA
jgi:hypothetical protein